MVIVMMCVGMESSSAASPRAAERGLQALLTRHSPSQASEAASLAVPAAAPARVPAPPLLPPGTVDQRLETQWHQFLLTNDTFRLQATMYVYILALIHHLQRYKETVLILCPRPSGIVLVFRIYQLIYKYVWNVLICYLHHQTDRPGAFNS